MSSFSGWTSPDLSGASPAGDTQRWHLSQDEGKRSALFVPDRDLASGAAPNYANAL
jgi:hypothetical protein